MERRTGPGRTILVVDDDTLLREMLVEMLVARGWIVEQARDGAVALERLRARAPDVVLLDQRMPRMTGEDLVLALRHEAIRVPIVLMSAGYLVTELAARLGIAFYLEKPFGIDPLDAMLEAAIAAHAAALQGA